MLLCKKNLWKRKSVKIFCKALLVPILILLMQEGHQAVAWRPHPSLFQLKLVPTAESDFCTIDDQL